ncbi:hypothetical protein GGI04_002785 [Coemansia thaxteri]|uniref:DUF1688-domain-containing protein n=1 Tax=Coemansia thaxteri TaxID=2663907 RepID=A0A9W8ELE4_9FUNG|nr:hypothetical protein GGI04_002785 [Coemansia thaxteri]KAJ2007975.1 hypothetical protein H4R26_000483 [Coemansia thaxteri]KAJ2484011.1 hypothetical protein EV174_002785 [Coemansia sp. RSA 2320]
MAASRYGVKYLKSLQAVRQQSQGVYERAERGKLKHFDFDQSKIESVADYVIKLIERDYGTIDKVPMHGRWRSYCLSPNGAGTKRDLVSEYVAKWKAEEVSDWECARRVIDLFMVSVLIDAGAGSKWRYKDSLGEFERTEGLGIAALRMFEKGVFSSSPANPFQADAHALMALTDEALLSGFQVTEENPLLGGENRAELLRSLGKAMRSGGAGYFGGNCACSNHPARPGYMIDYLAKNAEAPKTVSIDSVWEVVVDGLASVWPASRTQLDGVSLGDVWPCRTLAVPLGDDEEAGKGGQDVTPDVGCLAPFHKLSQWLTWSVLEVIVKLGKFNVSGTESLTGLPEYRNGGLFVDMGVLTLKEADLQRGMLQGAGNVPRFDGFDPVIVEWRAMTVILLDKVASIVRQKCCVAAGCPVPDMFLSRVLEGGTWKAGREIAARLRSETKDPPINIISDGTLF